MEDTQATLNPTLASLSSSRFMRVLGKLGWFIAGFFLLVLFTAIRMPDDKIKIYALNTLNQVISPYGLVAQPKETRMSYLPPGIRFTELNLRSRDGSKLGIDSIRIRVKILSLLMGKLSISFFLNQGAGSIDGTVSTSAFKPFVSALALNARIRSLDPSLLPKSLLPLQLQTKMDADLTLEGNPTRPATLLAQFNASFKSLKIPAQPVAISFFSLNLPDSLISSGTLDLQLKNNVLTFNRFNLGSPSPGSSDDLSGSLSGNVTLAPSVLNSLLNLKLDFFISQKIAQAIPLLPNFLAAFKAEDGSYKLNLNGPLSMPSPSSSKN